MFGHYDNLDIVSGCPVHPQPLGVFWVRCDLVGTTEQERSIIAAGCAPMKQVAIRKRMIALYQELQSRELPTDWVQ